MSANAIEGSTRAILYALAANGGIAVSKFIAAAYSGSGAMFAEGIHSTAAQMVDAINAVEDRIQRRWPQARYVFFEPDIR